MRPTSRFILSSTAAVAVLVSATLGIAWWRGGQRVQARHVRVQAQLAPPASLVAEGEHLVRSRGCVDCHGKALTGQPMIDKWPVLRVIAPNLTRLQEGAGVHGRVFAALHHGVRADGTSLLVMPAVYASLTQREIAAMSAYLSTMPASGPVQRASELGPAGRVLLALGQLPGVLTAEKIDHDEPMRDAPPPVASIEYGAHVATLCTGCHGADFAGGVPREPGAPAPPNITPHAAGLHAWTEPQFFDAMRTGTRPDGRRLDPHQMPWPSLGRSTDAELHALWRYLRTVSPAVRATDSKTTPPERS
jgi:cytochrome c553